MNGDTLHGSSARWSDKQKQRQEQVEESPFFTTIRQRGSSADYVTIHLENSHRYVIPVNDISQMHYAPDFGILLRFRNGHVQIQGRNLAKLQDALQQRKVTDIREFSKSNRQFLNGGSEVSDELTIEHIHYECPEMQTLIDTLEDKRLETV